MRRRPHERLECRHNIRRTWRHCCVLTARCCARRSTWISARPATAIGGTCRRCLLSDLTSAIAPSATSAMRCRMLPRRGCGRAILVSLGSRLISMRPSYESTEADEPVIAGIDTQAAADGCTVRIDIKSTARPYPSLAMRPHSNRSATSESGCNVRRRLLTRGNVRTRLIAAAWLTSSAAVRVLGLLWFSL